VNIKAAVIIYNTVNSEFDCAIEVMYAHYHVKLCVRFMTKKSNITLLLAELEDSDQNNSVCSKHIICLYYKCWLLALFHML